MILINMMMAIINLSFEEIKAHKDKYQSKFQLLEFIKRTAKELAGTRLADPIRVKYKGEEDDSSGDEEDVANQKKAGKEKKTSDEFAHKTDLLLSYIERIYMEGGFADNEESRAR